MHSLWRQLHRGPAANEALWVPFELSVESGLPLGDDLLYAAVEDVSGREEGEALMMVLAVPVEVLREVGSHVGTQRPRRDDGFALTCWPLVDR